MATTRRSRTDPGAAVRVKQESRSPNKSVVARQVQGQAQKSVCGSGCSSAGSWPGARLAMVELARGTSPKVIRAGTGGPGLDLDGATGPMSRDMGGGPPGRGWLGPLRLISVIEALKVCAYAKIHTSNHGYTGIAIVEINSAKGRR